MTSRTNGMKIRTGKVITGPVNVRSNSVSNQGSASGLSASNDKGNDKGGNSQAPAVDPPSASSTEMSRLTGPLVMTPISQLPTGPRRMSRVTRPEENPVTFDPEHYNIDGSLKTVHTLPNFDQSYAQARKARYCRQREPSEKEKELSIQQIFDKK